MLVIPAIDIKDGCCVRLVQGRSEEATTYSTDPLEMAQRWCDAGARRLHVVDLDGAFSGAPVNGQAIERIVRALPDMQVQVGGGIRTAEAAAAYLDAGVRWVILGTRAVQDPEFAEALCSAHPDSIIAGVDARSGKVATSGWLESEAELSAEAVAKRLAEAGVCSIIHTDIARDGMLQGVNVAASVSVARTAGIPVFASGGLAGLDDVLALRDCGEALITGVIAGKALYEGRLDLAEALRACA
ncbi:MAG: 1-(5-phosphoribosyl)-5-[(5-phosphoribosylamino)methylideneamino]imidazole-4-carboxamide isomerase [Gammaproteobacteria bacterium AqS3]|nr:1-(5-phosphoribosyl)-5-[(5-phosphoribosylamino)methylideneamino]imidazole-4-carboxamide isomerase [Gammaproteobacteria bacterium AqS3]